MKRQEKKEKKIVNDNHNKKFKKKKIIICCIIVVCMICLIVFLIMKKDKTIGVITLDTQANEIYEWRYEIGNEKIVSFNKKERFGDIEGKKDGAITEKYTFKSLKPGKTTIEFIYINTKNLSYGKLKTYKVVVDKKLKMTIEEISY